MAIKDDLAKTNAGFISVREAIEGLSRGESCSAKEAAQWLFEKRGELPKAVRKIGNKFIEDSVACVNGMREPFAPYVAMNFADGTDCNQADIYGWMKVDLLKALSAQGVQFAGMAANGSARKLRPGQQDKLDCQKVAAALWEKDPAATKASIIASDELKSFRTKYNGKNTLFNWLAEIDPRPKESRRGRPSRNTRAAKK